MQSTVRSSTWKSTVLTVPLISTFGLLVPLILSRWLPPAKVANRSDDNSLKRRFVSAALFNLTPGSPESPPSLWQMDEISSLSFLQALATCVWYQLENGRYCISLRDSWVFIATGWDWTQPHKPITIPGAPQQMYFILLILGSFAIFFHISLRIEEITTFVKP